MKMKNDMPLPPKPNLIMDTLRHDRVLSPVLGLWISVVVIVGVAFFIKNPPQGWLEAAKIVIPAATLILAGVAGWRMQIIRSQIEILWSRGKMTQATIVGTRIERVGKSAAKYQYYQFTVGEQTIHGRNHIGILNNSDTTVGTVIYDPENPALHRFITW